MLESNPATIHECDNFMSSTCAVGNNSRICFRIGENRRHYTRNSSYELHKSLLLLYNTYFRRHGQYGRVISDPLHLDVSSITDMN